LNQHLSDILDFLNSIPDLQDARKDEIKKAINDLDKLLQMNLFKLEKCMTDKRVMSVMLEETIHDLEQKRKEIEESHLALQKTLDELKSTQSQLIHSEKMASLGELTAGIAHEIQNPLNFVNNFSDVNSELIEELKEEIKQGNVEGINEILSNLDENEKKIVHHGKRAEDIVKSMLQHSRGSSGEPRSSSR